MPQGRTAKGAATAARIVAGAAEALLDLGIADTSLDDIRARSGASKSQLFHYFPGGKEQLLTEVARYEAERAAATMGIRMPPLTSWPAWTQWRDQVVGEYDRDGADCPLHNLISHLAPATAGAGAIARELLRQWYDHVRDGIAHMRDAGDIRPGLDPGQAASVVIAAVHGGASLTAITGSPRHLAAALDSAIAHLRGE